MTNSTPLSSPASRGPTYASFVVLRYPLRTLSIGLQSMAFDPSLIKEAGAELIKYGGTGSGEGFSALPDFTRYAFFSVWPSKDLWFQFLQTSEVMKRLSAAACEVWWIGLIPYRSHGTWDGLSIPTIGPTTKDQPTHSGDPRIAVLTRASIRIRSLAAFWSHVAPVSKETISAPGRICSVGFGELPWIRQATLSVWKDEASMKQFAYSSKAHAAVVKKTRTGSWYKEELFTRFYIDESGGSLGGKDPVGVGHV